MNTYAHVSKLWITKALIITSLAFPLNAICAESIGHVIQSVGTLTATNAGKARVLQRGSRIAEGDILKSGNSSISQLRMNDGALIALRPNTEFRFDEYRYTKDERSDSSIFSLLKGGFRTISGLIGKRNKQNYRVKTAVATIGIRGTHYGLTLCSQGDCNNPDGNIEDGLYGSVIDGEITTENKAGAFTFSNDEYFHVTSETGIPRRLIKPPGNIFGQQDAGRKLKKMKGNKQELASMLHKRNLRQGSMLLAKIDQRLDRPRPNFIAANDVNSNTYFLPSTTGNVLAYSFYEGLPGVLTAVNQTLVDDGTTANRFALNAIAADNGKFIPLASNTTFGAGAPQTRQLFFGEAQLGDVGSVSLPDGTQLGWGRWSGLYADTLDGVLTPHKGALHYVVASALTTPAQIGAMTGTFNYTTVAGTKATDLAGNVAANVANVNMNVSFGGTPFINMFSIATSVGGNAYQAELGPSGIALNTAGTTVIPLAGATIGACPNCSGQANLGFVGSQAEGAFTTYDIDNNAGNRINGATILKR